MRIECLPARSPLRASRRLPGGEFKASRKAAASTMISFRRATLARFAGKPFGTMRPSRINSANFPLKLPIMSPTYLIRIRWARLSYLGEILPDPIFLEQIACEFQSQPRSARHRHLAVDRHRRVVEQTPGPWHVFDHEPVRDGGDQMDVDFRQQVAGD